MKENSKKGRFGGSFLSTLLFFVMLAFVVTSGMVGFLLGRSATHSTGELVDTIVLSPEQSLASGRQEITHFLSGRVLYASGQPYANATVRINGSEKSDLTDEKGKFFLSDIRTGEHTLEVLDTQDRLLAAAPVSLEFQKGVEARADISLPDAFSFQLPDDIRMLEVTLTVDPEEGILSFQDGSNYAVTAGGDVIDFDGNALQLESQSFSVIPGGDVVSGSGYVVLPSKAAIVTPWGGVFEDETALVPETVPGAAVKTDGSVSLQNGVTVQPGGVVLLPTKEESVGPTENVVLIDNEAVEELPELPDEYTPSMGEDVPPVSEDSFSSGGDLSSAGEDAPSSNGDPSSADEEASSASEAPSSSSGNASEESLPEGSAVNGAPAGPSSSASPEGQSAPAVEQAGPEELPFEESEDAPSQETPTATPTETPAPTPDPLEIASLKTGLAWSQESIVDLFSNRTRGSDLGEEWITNEDGTKEAVPVIAPGSSGYYEFKLENDADYAIRFTLNIGERSFHLPIRYSVRDLENNYLYKGGSKINADGSAISTGYILLPAHSTRRYRLGWEWQYEDWLTPEKDDAYDTAATLSDDRTYIVSLGIDAEQVYSASNGHGDGVNYAGFLGY